MAVFIREKITQQWLTPLCINEDVAMRYFINRKPKVIIKPLEGVFYHAAYPNEWLEYEYKTVGEG